jgi:TatD DNase family protein
MKYFDAHCHLYMEQFAQDREAVLSRMQDGGFAAVVIGTDLKESKQAIELANQHDFLWASVGLHPNDNLSEQWIDISIQMEELARQPKVVAIGECGLDYFRSGGIQEEKAVQRERFVAQAMLAQKVGKALIIHCRNAHDDMLEILSELELTIPVIIHFFTGSGELAQKYLDLGCYLSFPGPITYTTDYDDSIRVCPLNRMLSETDSPFAAPVPNRGKRNEPLYIPHIVAKIASIKGVPEEEVAKATVENALKVFKLHGDLT